MKTLLYKIQLLTLVFLGISTLSIAQPGVGSFETSDGLDHVTEGTFKFVYSETLYLGPQADWQIDGEVHVYSRRVWISPTAKISGTGTLYIHSPGDNPFYEDWPSSRTIIDGNGADFIGVNIILTNTDGLELSDFEAEGYAGGTGDASRTAALKIGKSIDLRVDGASIYLNGFDLELSSTGDLLNHNLHRMVVTGDHLTGHLIRHYTSLGSLFFPVGIAQGDYTPARLTPQSANSRVHVSVNSYAASGLAITDETLGMDRVWNIFADQAMQMDYTLTHNSQTNGIAYVDASARIVQDADGGNWIGDVTVLEGEGLHTREDIQTVASPTLTGTWFTKFSMSPPTAVDDIVTMEYGSDITINVLENDVPGSSAIVRSSVEVIVPPRHGRYVVNADGSVTYTPDEGFVGEDEFEYEITDENGLTSRAVVRITVLPRELFIPNVITPNGDGKNDRLVIVGREGYDRISIVIVNRWGNEVYRNDDYKDEWEGRGLNEGTYFPIIRAIKGGQERVFKGHVLIKRN